MDHNGATEKSRQVLKILFLCALIFTVVIAVYLTSVIRGIPNNDEKITYIDHWTVTDAQGNTIKAGRTYEDARIYREDFTATSKLPNRIREDSALYFLNRSNVDVFVHGKLRRSFREEREIGIPGGAVKDFYISVPLKASDAGSEITIIKYKGEWHPTVISETIIATSRGMYHYLFERYGISFVMSVGLLIAALMVTLVGLIMRLWYRRKIDMLYAALGILDVACWLLAVSQITPFLTRAFYVDGIMGFLFCMMMPFGFLIYIDSIQDGRYHKCHAIIFIALMVSMILWTTLHLAGVMSLQSALVYIDSLLGLSVLGVMATLLIDIKKGYIREYRYTAIGLGIFMLLSILEIVLIIGIRNETNDLPIILGLLSLLIFVLFQQIDDIREVREHLESEVRERIAENEQMLIHIVQTLAGTIDAKDTYTNGHSSRVASYSREIARRAGYDEAALTDIYMMGLLHDIGKIGIPDAVINKPGKLTSEEYETIKTHPELGDGILQNIKEKPELSMGARWHHERYGGGGYPDGIRGEEIPEAARIIAVADAYDAMTSHRSYREPMDKQQVKAEIEKWKGIQFDPRFANIMLQMMAEDKDDKLRETES